MSKFNTGDKVKSNRPGITNGQDGVIVRVIYEVKFSDSGYTSAFNESEITLQGSTPKVALEATKTAPIEKVVGFDKHKTEKRSYKPRKPKVK